MRKLMEKEIGKKELDKMVEAILTNDQLSKSGKMKGLFNLGLEVKEIASLLGVRYNFVYNVVSNLVIVEGLQTETSMKDSKKDVVWGLLDQGKTVKEIAVDLKTSYNYVHKLKKEWEAKAVAELEKLEGVQ